MFTETITHASRKCFQANATWVDRVIPRHVLELHIPQNNNNNKNNDDDNDYDSSTVTLLTGAHISNTVGKYSDNPSLRKLVFMETNTACVENLEVLDALIEYRHRVAVRQGFESYADRFL